MKIIGITGTLGAGKGTVVEYLVHEKGFSHYSVREYLAREIIKRGLPVNRDTLTSVANDLRRQYGPSFVTDQLYAKAMQQGHDCVIESIRTPGEIASLREKGDFMLLAVDAEPTLRFQRITGRKSETDNISFDTFLANEAREMTTEDSTKQNLRACIEQADYRLRNDGSTEDLFRQVEKILSEHPQ
jgi:dephospho-CoA kinase